MKYLGTNQQNIYIIFKNTEKEIKEDLDKWRYLHVFRLKDFKKNFSE